MRNRCHSRCHSEYILSLRKRDLDVIADVVVSSHVRIPLTQQFNNEPLIDPSTGGALARAGPRSLRTPSGHLCERAID